jgi:hypothetical protein
LPIHFRIPRCKKLQTVDLSKTCVTVITELAFGGCETLSTVLLPVGFTEVGVMAFRR